MPPPPATVHSSKQFGKLDWGPVVQPAPNLRFFNVSRQEDDACGVQAERILAAVKRVLMACEAVGRLSRRRFRSLLVAGGNMAPATSGHGKAREGERGQNLMEFALILPVILIFLLTVVDFGLALDRREVIQSGVREGARAGATGLSEDEVIEYHGRPFGRNPRRHHCLLSGRAGH